MEVMSPIPFLVGIATLIVLFWLAQDPQTRREQDPIWKGIQWTALVVVVLWMLEDLVPDSPILSIDDCDAHTACSDSENPEANH